uniref:Testis expressed 43 n=1 Tax=Esox lucius TaxID=8010 RepID=A0AAY5L7X1_ESOLU
YTNSHVTEFSIKHPMIPKLYVMPWKQDMKNQRLLIKNAALAGVPHEPQEESLYFEGRERLCHEQDRGGILELSAFSATQTGLEAQNASHFSRYNSSVVTTCQLYSYPLRD